jgi:1,2-diacylglycerol 3-beta-glucosyltransferase
MIDGLLALAAVTAAIATYLGALTCAAVLIRRSVPPDGPQRRRFAICVPAHNEEVYLPRLLGSIARIRYSPSLIDVHVVADNCLDLTATVARAAGAFVHERVDSERQGKGHALSWLLERVLPNAYDAYVIVDADSILDENFLAAMDARLDQEAEVIQAFYAVSNADRAPLASLRACALAAIHYVRPLGRAALGLSVGLKGNGMCFSRAVAERFGWRWFGLAEDVESHLTLVAAGVRVHFAPETRVLGEMPTSFRQAKSQNERWEGGRLQALRTRVPHLVLDGLRMRSATRLDAAAEQLIPPLSLVLSAAGLVAIGGILAGRPEVAWIGMVCVSTLVAHLIVGMVMTGASGRMYAALAVAPLYVLWKLALYGRVLATQDRRSKWIRTDRPV